MLAPSCPECHDIGGRENVSRGMDLEMTLKNIEDKSINIPGCVTSDVGMMLRVA